MPWQSLAHRLNSLPLVLAGPILRRTESNAVTVWIALKEARTVTLKVFENSSSKFLLTGEKPTVKLGEHLHVVAVTADQGTALSAGEIYHYDLSFHQEGEANNTSLISEDVLIYQKANDLSPISYTELDYPSFSLPPENLEQVRLIHGSCRKPHAEGVDALAYLDKLIEQNYTNAETRPHQLFLTGDQIYADDVADSLLYMLDDASRVLLGQDNIEPLPKIDGDRQNQLTPGNRSSMVRDLCGFTAETSAAKSHLFRLGEFFSMYLFAWSEVLWVTEADFPDFQEVCKGKDSKVMVTIYQRKGDDIKEVALPKDSEALITFRQEQERLKTFRKTLTSVRRALANIPTYMILDDHEITDDLFFNPAWTERVLGQSLGKRVILNGLIAYSIFQAWGNTPKQFDDHIDFLNLVSDRINNRKWDDNLELTTEIESYLLRTSHKNHNSGPIQPANPIISPLSWHYSIKATSYHVLVLDTRTWRAYTEQPEFPALISKKGMEEQLRSDLFHSTMTLIVSAGPVIGLSKIEQTQKSKKTLKDRLEIDAEAWSLNQETFERLFSHISAQLGGQGRVVFLSGDVHYGFAARYQYWATQRFEKGGEAELIVVQLTSSALKNEQREGFWKIPNLMKFSYNLHWAASLVVTETERFFGWETPGIVGHITAISQRGSRITPWVVEGKPAIGTLSDEYRRYSDEIITFRVKSDKKPQWVYRIDFIKGEKSEPVELPNSREDNKPLDSRINNLKQQTGVARQQQKNVKTWGAGRWVVGLNNIGEVYFYDPEYPDAKAQIYQKLYWWDDSKADSVQTPPLSTRYTIDLKFDNSSYPKPSILTEDE